MCVCFPIQVAPKYAGKELSNALWKAFQVRSSRTRRVEAVELECGAPIWRVLMEEACRVRFRLRFFIIVSGAAIPPRQLLADLFRRAIFSIRQSLVDFSP